MLADFKQNENDQVRELEEQNEELKNKLDKTEYIIQYKEKIWTYLEREIRKVVNEDSELMRKVQAETKILTDCLATTQVSNVVKMNDNLINDHTMGCDKLQQINEKLRRELIEHDEIESIGGGLDSGDDPRNAHNPAYITSWQKRERLRQQMKGSLFGPSGSMQAIDPTKMNDPASKQQRLYQLVNELESLVDA